MFFKRFREEWKLERLVGGLENAIQTFRPDFPWETNTHLKGAKKALAYIQQAHVEHKLTAIGWDYIVKLCSQLKTKALAHGLMDMARDCDSISEYATRMTARSVNPPAAKDADPRQAIILAKELLAGHIPQQEILSEVEAFVFDDDEPLSYSTHDLALSVALKFFTQTERIPQLFQAQLLARMKALQWHREGLVATTLVKSFEEALYELYKPDY